MTYTPHSLTLPIEITVTARRMENGDCEIDMITKRGRRIYPLNSLNIFTPQEFRDLCAAWLDAEEAAKRNARELRNQP